MCHDTASTIAIEFYLNFSVKLFRRAHPLIYLSFFLMNLFTADVQGWEIQKNELHLTVQKVTDFELPQIPTADFHEALNIARKILRRKLGVEVKFHETVEIGIQKYMLKDIPKDMQKNAQMYIQERGAGLFKEKEETKFQEVITRRAEGGVKLISKLTLDDMEKASFISPGDSAKISTPDDFGKFVHKRFLQFLAHLKKAKLNGIPVVRKGKEYLLFVESWPNRGLAVYKKKAVNLYMTNEPVIAKGWLFSPGTLAFTCCHAHAGPIVSAFPLYFGFQTKTSSLNVAKDMRVRVLGYTIAWSVAHGILKAYYSPFVYKKSKGRRTCFYNNITGMGVTSRKDYDTLMSSPACSWEKDRAQIYVEILKALSFCLSRDFESAEKVLLGLSEKHPPPQDFFTLTLWIKIKKNDIRGVKKTLYAMKDMGFRGGAIQNGPLSTIMRHHLTQKERETFDQFIHETEEGKKWFFSNGITWFQNFIERVLHFLYFLW